MPPFDDEPSWVFTNEKEVQEEYDDNGESDSQDDDGDDDGGDGSLVVETVNEGDESSSEESTEREEESQEEEKSSEVSSDNDSSSEDLANSSYYNESGVVGGVATGDLLGDPEDANSVSVFPEGFGGLGSSMSSFPRNQSEEEYDNDPESGALEHYYDEPEEPLSSLHYARSVDSADDFGGGLEPIFEDEYEDSTRESLRRSSSIKSIRSTVPRIWNRRECRFGTLLFCLLLVIFAICFGVTKAIAGKGSENVEEAKVVPTPAPIAVPSPTLVPVYNGDLTPKPSPSVLFPSTVFVPVHLDGYLWLGGIILRDVEVQHSPTLLIQDGLHMTSAVSIVEFDTSSTLTAHPLNSGSVKRALVSLTVADVDIDYVSEVVTLYARLYPNDLGSTPDFDINAYGWGYLDFDKDWITFELHMDQTNQAEIDVTDYFQKQYFPTQQNKDVWDNVKILIAHDNTDGKLNQGARVRFYSSDSASEAQKPRLTINLEPPNLTISPAPSRSPFPSAFPTVSSAPSKSIQPSGSPSKSPTLHPTSSASPTYNPTVSPEPTIDSYPVCSICRALVLDDPKTRVPNSFGFDSLRGDTSDSWSTTCGSLEQAALDGQIRPKQCEEIQAKVKDVCCREPDDGTPRFNCNLCGGVDDNGGGVLNSEVVVKLPVAGEAMTCGQYQTKADLGLIPEGICDALQPYTTEYCCTILL